MAFSFISFWLEAGDPLEAFRSVRWDPVPAGAIPQYIRIGKYVVQHICLITAYDTP
ncbi:hypothetical protein EYZ11_010898 [Aspergillus tanneri]|uniref:Uncharacterized protein n=1 Tax=Aspergillus tanneri TaxID=1220188 RepID=A0A4S3J461_9EURO|nr:hypothetical protein EYZ11_010898 [Aspergillus tanneri]